MSYFIFLTISIFRTSESSEDVLLNNIQKCADAVNTNVIEHTAFIRASAAQSNLNLDEYRDQVRQELSLSNEQSRKKKGIWNSDIFE